jgi:hypothetical protein
VVVRVVFLFRLVRVIISVMTHFFRRPPRYTGLLGFI